MICGGGRSSGCGGEEKGVFWASQGSNTSSIYMVNHPKSPVHEKTVKAIKVALTVSIEFPFHECTRFCPCIISCHYRDKASSPEPTKENRRRTLQLA